ncbi:Putative purine permease ygfU [Serratia fonticola]|uniref:Purine permease ygfU n=1 Tax=Serratia fonticola TaxID=47917 RepID=A0A4U9W452_SERFO|nr:Putative purine permease ygfU [Serratia fonticola]
MLIFILLITRFSKGFISNISVLLGIGFGFVVALLMGEVSFSGLNDAAWFAIVRPFAFGWPTFDPAFDYHPDDRHADRIY